MTRKRTLNFGADENEKGTRGGKPPIEHLAAFARRLVAIPKDELPRPKAKRRRKRPTS